MINIPSLSNPSNQLPCRFLIVIARVHFTFHIDGSVFHYKAQFLKFHGDKKVHRSNTLPRPDIFVQNVQAGTFEKFKN